MTVESLERVEGAWQGAIEVPNSPLPIEIQFTKTDGTISIPVQGLDNYKLSSVKLKDDSILLEMNMQGQRITFDGKINDDTISGTFTQNGSAIPFALKKGALEVEEEIGEAVSVEVLNGTMKGLLVKPEGDGPFPVMIIIAGSGPTDHNGNSIAIPGKNNSLKMIAEGLAEQGIASIRYDKRGVGQNVLLAGKEEDVTFEHFIDDARAFVEFAKSDKQFSKVGIIGHSEGSLIGMVAAGKTNIDGFVSIAGAGRPIGEVLLEQLEAQLPEKLLTESKDILRKLAQGELVTNVSPELQSVFRPSVQPYMISWLAYNPAEEIQKLNSKVLIINGTNDIQVPVKDAEALYDAKVASTLLLIKNMNHILKEAPADVEGNLATYSDPNLPLAEGLLEGIVEFVK
ncbi:serine aminopeptidase domain-containing protein [Psychrobacillus sp.]|uniref:alpha/beta hydrolase family protein n=1 Tax=Psychrobacillus sp. TaxID=1871623 RepID=UPI0028BD2D35|nr:alpha/beta hydrolase [Psychrobacillus sp.]